MGKEKRNEVMRVALLQQAAEDTGTGPEGITVSGSRTPGNSSVARRRNARHSEFSTDKHQQGLQELKKRTENVAEQMKGVTGALEISSSRLTGINTILSSFNSTFAASRKAFKDLERRSASDQRYLLAAFFFFMWTCAHILMKRTGIYWSILAFWRWFFCSPR